MKEFESQVPTIPDFPVGYYHGRLSTKYWLMCQSDLEAMYKSVEQGSGKILLWCDAYMDQASREIQSQGKGKKRKHPAEEGTSRREKNEQDVDELVQKLKEKHGTKYSLPQLRLWGRMIQAGNHEDLDDPPRVPAIVGTEPKREKKESLMEALAGAAVTIVNAIRSPGQLPHTPTITSDFY